MRTFAVLFVVLTLTGCATVIGLDDTYDAGGCLPSKSGPTTTADSGEPDAELEAEAPDAETREDTALPDTSTEPTGDPCSDCLRGKCGTEVAACLGDTMCTDLMDCLSPCFDDACASACFGKFPSPEYESFAICGQTKCSAVCL